MNTIDNKERNWQEMSRQARQLFSSSAPINKSALFAGRIEQIQRLMDAIFERGRHAVLYGEQGVGKTSLTNILHEVIDHTIKYLIFRKQSSPQDDYSSLWLKILKDAAYNNSGTLKTVEHYEGKKLNIDDVLRELENICRNKPVIIIFDEFDKLVESEVKKLMSYTIKAISDSGINATVILVGVAEDIGKLIDAHESVTRNIEQIKMPRMSERELGQILDIILPLIGLEIEPGARNNIICLARGLPEYIHALGKNSSIQAIESKRTKIKKEDVELGVKRLLEQSAQSLSDSYKKAIHSNRKKTIYRQILLACALAVSQDEGKFSPADIVHPLEKILKEKHITISTFQSHLVSFCSESRGRILEKHGTPRAFRYQFREPKMQPYVIMQGMILEDINVNELKSI